MGLRQSSLNDRRNKTASYYRLKTLLNNNRRVDYSSSKSFSKLVQQAVYIRNKNIRQIKRFIQTVSKSKLNTNELIKICDNVIADKFTLAVVGRLNSGKSMLVSALLDWRIVLPTSDEATTGRLTRFVYCERPVVRKIKTGEWREYGWCNRYEESIEIERQFDDGRELAELICLSEESRGDIDALSIIIEIGLPVDVLKHGLTIVDCPGMDENKLMSMVELEVLDNLKPSLLIYVYDSRPGFSLTDGSKLKSLLDRFYRYLEPLECVILANKCDSFDENSNDDNITSFDSFNVSEANKQIRLNCPWKDFITKPFIDKDKLLPVVPFSVATLYLSHSTGYNRSNPMIRSLHFAIASRIIEQSISFLADLASNIHENNTKLYFLIKNLSIESDLIELIKHSQKKGNLLANFNDEFHIYGLEYNDNRIHVTIISINSSDDHHRKRVYFETLTFPSPLVYTDNEDESKIYLIEKDRPFIRLMDQLHNYSIDQCITWIREISSLTYNIFQGLKNFRIDNLYVDDNNRIYMNRSVPNNPQLPFLTRNGRCIPAFHIQAQLKSLYPYYNDKKVRELRRIEFLFCLGCMIWVLIHGREEEDVFTSITADSEPEWLSNLDSFSCCSNLVPEPLIKIMKLCLQLELTENVVIKDIDNMDVGVRIMMLVSQLSEA